MSACAVVAVRSPTSPLIVDASVFVITVLANTEKVSAAPRLTVAVDANAGVARLRSAPRRIMVPANFIT